MSLGVDLYRPTGSWLDRRDPRVKLLGTVAGSAAAFLLPGVGGVLFVLLSVLIVLRLGRVPGERLRWVLRGLLPVSLLILLIQPWFVAEGRVLLALGPATLTVGGLLAALTIAVRANALALLALTPLFTTRSDDLVRGLVHLGLPYPWGLTITLALRYIPVAAGLYTTIRQAQEARGLDVTQGGLVGRARRFVPVLTALVIASVRLSDQLAMAMTVRGLGHGPRTERRVLRLNRFDWLAAGIIAAGLAAVVVWRVLAG